MKLEAITNTPSYTQPVPAFNFLFAASEPKNSSRRKPSWFSRTALRTKRV